MGVNGGVRKWEKRDKHLRNGSNRYQAQRTVVKQEVKITKWVAGW